MPADTGKITLAHGAGGMQTQALIREIFFRHLGNDWLAAQHDAATLPPRTDRTAVTTDSFVVDPVVFPGGNIGKLAVCGTINDLAVTGAVPAYLTAGFILEEGLETDLLDSIVAAMGEAARAAGVSIVAGDTKVVGRGSADKLFVNTTGIGYIHPKADLSYGRIAPGDLLLINGFIGDHGVAILSCRQNLAFTSPVLSDCAGLNGIIADLLDNCPGIKFMRDPTRGGVATTAKEIAAAAKVDIYLEETALPVRDAVTGACELLGLDPLYLANEGKFLAIVDPAAADAVLARLRAHPLGRDAAVIGEVKAGPGNCYLRTVYGGTRYLDLLAGEMLPRIC